MVHKRSHHGVHSGNTLRAFNSRYSRRYHTQSCIVSRVRPELLQKLVGGPKPDKKNPEVNNIAVNVPLSLNKQSRWFLPSTLIRQIKTNDIAESELTVSVLERHKLKQTANCVSFHSNKGEVKRIQPRNGRYFGYNDPVAGGKSRRALRRELFAARKNQTQGKTVQVYTEQGSANTSMGLGESEVRYEVFYPSSSKSSISHNPKYIKQDMLGAPGEGEEHALQGKPKKQRRGKQRKRMSVKDLDACDLPAYQGRGDHSLTAVADPEDCGSVDGAREEQSATECLITTLIEKAQQLQKFKGVAKSRDRKKKGNNSRHYEDDKSHIVYLYDSETPASPPDTTPGLTPPLTFPAIPAPEESTRVLLPKDDVTLAGLKECFGQKYFEAACKPRKFVLDVSSNVQDVLGKQRIVGKVAEKFSSAYLICIHDGFFDDEFDVYKVLLNSRLHEGLLAVQINTEENQDLFRGTLMNLISHTMDFVEGLVMELKTKNHFPAFLDGTAFKVPAERQVNRHFGSAEAYMPSLQRIFQMGSETADFTMPSLSDMLDEDSVFCDVCYDDISPLTHNSAAFTALLKCKHQVCDSCWSQHIHARLHEGFVRLTCPGYDCQNKVKLGVLLSVAPLGTVEKMLQRQEEVRVGGSDTEKWCPNESCGRVISIQASSSPGDPVLQQDVVCTCGLHVCFQCMTPAHWPASCSQADQYRSSLDAAALPDRLAEVHIDHEPHPATTQSRDEEKKIMTVEGKFCPGCRNFVYKNGGCPQMSCRCGLAFCWYCAKPGPSHLNRQGCVDEKKEKAITTTLIVHHLKADKETKEENQSLVNRRQRVSLLEKAVEHRQLHHNKQQNLASITTLATNVASAAAKNSVLTQPIVKACTEAFPSSHTKPSFETQASRRVSVLETVTVFLKNAARSKQELHEVVEYSMVLLKDIPDSLLRRRALRVSEDLGAFCSFSQSVFDAWSHRRNVQGHYQEAVKAVMRLAEIQRWIQSALDTHISTVKKLRSVRSPQRQ
ncbi:hypothetical protein ACOMHN_033683 [Nucella lapillus]